MIEILKFIFILQVIAHFGTVKAHQNEWKKKPSQIGKKAAKRAGTSAIERAMSRSTQNIKTSDNEREVEMERMRQKKN